MNPHVSLLILLIIFSIQWYTILEFK